MHTDMFACSFNAHKLPNVHIKSIPMKATLALAEVFYLHNKLPQINNKNSPGKHSVCWALTIVPDCMK